MDYTVLYDEIVRTTLWEEVYRLGVCLSLFHSSSFSLPPSSSLLQDTTRLYWPSSPSNGVLDDDKDRGLFIQRWGDVANPNYGDVHR